MFDFLTGSQVVSVYHHVMFVISIGIAVFLLSGDIRNVSARLSLSVFGLFFLLIYVLFMGTRPVSGAFGDMGSYAAGFSKFSRMDVIPVFSKDKFFNIFMWSCSKFMTKGQFFLLVDILYILPCYLFARKYCGTFWFLAFFLFVSSFSFWSYGTNGIRNGLATALFIFGLVFYDRKVLLYLFLFLAYNFHNSMIIPVAAFIVSGLYKNPRIYLFAWLAAIPLSLAAGGFFQGLLGGLVADDRASSYLTKSDIGDDGFGSTGFRWDFILYSASAVYAGWYYIFRKGITDKFYIHLYGTYMAANTFWILVIKANFSNRFAYLSWFLMAAVIGYPLFRYKLADNQYKVAAAVLFLYFGFTYFMFLNG